MRLDEKPAANINRPKASLTALKNRYGYRDDGSKRPMVVTIQCAKTERWERVIGTDDLYVMTSP